MMLVLDMGVSPRAADALAGKGHDVVHLGRIGLGDLDDEQITIWARDEGRAIYYIRSGLSEDRSEA